MKIQNVFYIESLSQHLAFIAKTIQWQHNMHHHHICTGMIGMTLSLRLVQSRVGSVHHPVLWYREFFKTCLACNEVPLNKFFNTQSYSFSNLSFRMRVRTATSNEIISIQQRNAKSLFLPIHLFFWEFI